MTYSVVVMFCIIVNMLYVIVFALSYLDMFVAEGILLIFLINSVAETSR